MINLFAQGLLEVLSPHVLIFMILGVIVGIIFGAVPGLTAVMAVALFLPMTYGTPPEMGLSILIALYIGAISGGLISAILLKIPGTPASMATCFDGHPMRMRGEGPKALGVSILYSFIGTMLSLIALVFIAPPLAKIALRFGPHEYFSIAIFSLTLIATLSSGSMIKGLFSGILGIAFSTVGIAPVDAVVRFSFGFSELIGGFAILTVLIGLFAISELIKIAEEAKKINECTVENVNLKGIKGFGLSMKEFIQQIPNCVRSGFIGIGIGILPGIGAGTSNIISYLIAKKRSKHPEKFGTGIIDGLIASETCNNASIGGALIPLMTLGIPGDGVTAILLGGFMIHGIAPGPMLFVNYGKLVYTIFSAILIASILMLIIEFYGLRLFIKILCVPRHILLPIIFVLCAVGAFALNNRIFDVWTIFLFGLIGYMFVKFKIPQAPFVIGFILGPMAELNFRRGLMLSDGKLSGFITSPISAIFLILAFGSIIWSIIGYYIKRNKPSI